MRAGITGSGRSADVVAASGRGRSPVRDAERPTSGPEVRKGLLTMALAGAWAALVFGSYIVLHLRIIIPKLIELMGSR
ncbi:MAG: hypothetical protein HY704_01540 [Gemmatimonadetes bacterium]|nr:hypothetical protein [Gemmatimonadota bacterium]